MVEIGFSDASGKGVGSVAFAHHPYLSGSCAYFPASSPTSYYQDMPNWYAGSGTQSFTMDLASLLKTKLTGVDPATVASATVYLLDYSDFSQPTATFGNLAFVAKEATTLTAAPVTVVKSLTSAGVTMQATLVSQATGAPVPAEAVSFTMASSLGTISCTGTTDATGTARCTVPLPTSAARRRRRHQLHGAVRR